MATSNDIHIPAIPLTDQSKLTKLSQYNVVKKAFTNNISFITSNKTDIVSKRYILLESMIANIKLAKVKHLLISFTCVQASINKKYTKHISTIHAILYKNLHKLRGVDCIIITECNMIKYEILELLTSKFNISDMPRFIFMSENNIIDKPNMLDGKLSIYDYFKINNPRYITHIDSKKYKYIIKDNQGASSELSQIEFIKILYNLKEGDNISYTKIITDDENVDKLHKQYITRSNRKLC